MNQTSKQSKPTTGKRLTAAAARWPAVGPGAIGPAAMPEHYLLKAGRLIE